MTKKINKSYSLKETTIDLIDLIAQRNRWTKSMVIEVALEGLAVYLQEQKEAAAKTQPQEG